MAFFVLLHLRMRKQYTHNMNKTTLTAIAVLSVMTLPAIADENNTNTASTKLATKTVELSDTSRVYDIDEVVVVDQPKDARAVVLLLHDRG